MAETASASTSAAPMVLPSSGDDGDGEDQRRFNDKNTGHAAPVCPIIECIMLLRTNIKF
jgi:hypothetical protein